MLLGIEEALAVRLAVSLQSALADGLGDVRAASSMREVDPSQPLVAVKIMTLEHRVGSLYDVSLALLVATPVVQPLDGLDARHGELVKAVRAGLLAETVQIPGWHVAGWHEISVAPQNSEQTLITELRGKLGLREV